MVTKSLIFKLPDSKDKTFLINKTKEIVDFMESTIKNGMDILAEDKRKLNLAAKKRTQGLRKIKKMMRCIDENIQKSEQFIQQIKQKLLVLKVIKEGVYR